MKTKHKNLLKRYALGQYLCFSKKPPVSFFDALLDCQEEDEFFDLLKKHDVEVWEPWEFTYFMYVQEHITNTYQLLTDVYNLAKEQ